MAVIITPAERLASDNAVRLTDTRTGSTVETLVTDARPLEVILPRFVEDNEDGSPGLAGFQGILKLAASVGSFDLDAWVNHMGAEHVLDALEEAVERRFEGETPHNSIADRLGHNPVTRFRAAL